MSWIVDDNTAKTMQADHSLLGRLTYGRKVAPGLPINIGASECEPASGIAAALVIPGTYNDTNKTWTWKYANWNAGAKTWDESPGTEDSSTIGLAFDYAALGNSGDPSPGLLIRTQDTNGNPVLALQPSFNFTLVDHCDYEITNVRRLDLGPGFTLTPNTSHTYMGTLELNLTHDAYIDITDDDCAKKWAWLGVQVYHDECYEDTDTEHDDGKNQVIKFKTEECTVDPCPGIDRSVRWSTSDDSGAVSVFGSVPAELPSASGLSHNRNYTLQLHIDGDGRCTLSWEEAGDC